MPDYLLRIEPTDTATPLTVHTIEKEFRARGFAPRHAERVEHGWYLRVGTPLGSVGPTAAFPGWRVTEASRVLDGVSWSAADSRAVGELFTFILLQWPAVIGLFLLGGSDWQLALKIAVAVWLALMHAVAYAGSRGMSFGNTLLMLSGCVAAFWWTHPGPWMYLWLVIILIGVYAGVRGALRGGEQPVPAAAAEAGV